MKKHIIILSILLLVIAFAEAQTNSEFQRKSQLTVFKGVEGVKLNQREMQNITGKAPAIEIVDAVVRIGVGAYSAWEIGSKVYHTATRGRSLERDSLSLGRKLLRFGRRAYRRMARLSKGRWSNFYWF